MFQKIGFEVGFEKLALTKKSFEKLNLVKANYNYNYVSLCVHPFEIFFKWCKNVAILCLLVLSYNAN